MNRHIYTLMKGIAILFISLIAGACSREADILSTIPANNTVAVINGVELLTQSGFKIEQSRVSAPDGVLPNQRLMQYLNEAAGLADNIDFTRMYMVVSEANLPFITFRISDSGELADKLRECGFDNMGSSDGYERWRGNEFTVCFSGSQGWIVDPRSNVSPAHLIAEGDNTFTEKHPGITEFLGSDGLVNIAVTSSTIGLGTEAEMWLCATMAPGDKNSLDLSFTLLNSEGEEQKIPELTKLSSSVLDKLPSQAPVLAALGFDNGIDTSSLTSMAALSGNFQLLGIIQTLEPLLEKLHGTIAFAASPQSGDSWGSFDLSDWNLRLLVEFEDGGAESAMTELRTFLKDKFIPMTSTANGFIANFGTTPIASEADGGIFSVNMGSFSEGNGAPDFMKGSYGGFAVSLPGEFMPGGVVQANLRLDKSAARFSICYPGSNEPFLKVLAKSLL